jgi:phosphate transport system permease protein
VSLEAPHPEVTARTLFGKVWYEGYDAPEHVWQSTGSTDDFEPKLGLTPLVFGTLKGTFYALLFAVPTAILAAIYTALFSQPRLRAVIKPTVELMAGLPSVVIGFLAGLWLAPLVERHLAGALLSILLVPALILAATAVWGAAPVQLRKRVPAGAELAALIPLTALSLLAAAALGPHLEQWAFEGDLRTWIFQTLGLQYDQRNALVVGFAMGFAVIPIIFTISEDAISSVPERLLSGALALGASRWQAALRVVLPTASPAIFSAVMVGFGRAVGETMIVLMATGNTPVLDWSLFNGLRTLSANIAVEMPEAPHGGTLYRVLFVTAGLLFLITFAVNTAAEIVRMRLRERYARL